MSIGKVLPYIKLLQYGAKLCSIELDLTNDCICKCHYCSQWKWKKNKPLSFDIIKRDLEEVRPETLVLSGGEPTLHPDLFKILRLANKLNIKVGILTSGQSKLKVFEWRKALDLCSWIRFSIDSFIDKVYKQLRGCSLKTVYQLLEDIGFNDNKIRINYLVNEKNYFDKHIEKAHDAATALKLPIAFHLEKNFAMNLEKYDLSHIRDIEAFSKRTDAPVRFYEYDKPDKFYPCVFPKLAVNISTNGDVWPCCYLGRNIEPQRKYAERKIQKYELGCVYNSPLKQIWDRFHSNYLVNYNDLFANMRNYKDKLPECLWCRRHKMNEFVAKKINNVAFY